MLGGKPLFSWLSWYDLIKSKHLAIIWEFYSWLRVNQRENRKKGSYKVRNVKKVKENTKFCKKNLGIGFYIGNTKEKTQVRTSANPYIKQIVADHGNSRWRRYSVKRLFRYLSKIYHKMLEL
jgi:hypothetical protein